MYRYSEMSSLLREIRLQNKESGQMTLTALSEDSHANRSALPAREKVKKTKDSCGENLAASLARLDRVGLSLKTYLDSSVSHLTTYLPIWKVKATDASRLYIRLQLSGHRTEERGFSLWRTPDANCDRGPSSLARMEWKLRWKMPISLNDQVKHCQNWPTPHANCSTGAGKHGKGGENLQTATGASLNPDWVEMLMGFNIGWTNIDCDEPAPWPGWPAPMGVDQYSYESPRVGTGIPHRAKRLKALGNAVVPQQAYPIFRAIMEVANDG